MVAAPFPPALVHEPGSLLAHLSSAKCEETGDAPFDPPVAKAGPGARFEGVLGGSIFTRSPEDQDGAGRVEGALEAHGAEE